MKKSIRDYNLKNKTVIIRCDFNVPIINGQITDDKRIVESLKTIKYAVDNNARVILMSHLSKIKSEYDKKNNSLEIVKERLSELLNKEVLFSKNTRGVELENLVNNLEEKDILLIENTRFEDYPDKKESSNDEELGKYWASLGDIFINDAFGTIHRKHASNYGIAQYIPSGIGFLIEEEISKLSLLKNPQKPYVVILGGAKISDKIKMIESLAKKSDKMIIGGAMAYTFLKACGYNTGNSLVDEESIEFAKNMMAKYHNKIILPDDHVVSKIFKDTNENNTVDSESILDNYIGLDIGAKTIEKYKDILKDAKTIFWNGTLGYSEFDNYSNGTKSILDFISKLNATTVLGGGDTVSAAKKLGFEGYFTHQSTGGGATLELIADETLPSYEIINDLE